MPALTCVQAFTVAVVDDSLVARLMLKELMVAFWKKNGQKFKTTRGQRLKLRILEARDGLEAYEMFQTNNVDAAFLDLSMPVSDGFEVLEKVQANERLRGLPVIICSALETELAVVRAIERGAMDYLFKPINQRSAAHCPYSTPG